MGTPRRAYRLTSADGTTTVISFPKGLYEWEPDQAFRTAIDTVVGADYAYDHHGRGPSPVEPAQETVRGILVCESTEALDAEMSAIRGALRTMRGAKIWTIDDSGAARWAWARPRSAQPFLIDGLRDRHAPAVFELSRLSDFYPEAPEAGGVAIDGTPQQFAINNPGTLPAQAVTFRFRANGPGGFTAPTLRNLTNGHQFQHDRTALDEESELRINTGTFDADWSIDAGQTYAPDYANLAVPSEQFGWMPLEPGDNVLSYEDDGSPDLDIEWEFFAPYVD